ncbi:MAG: hypothetical protein WBA16_07215 [Nonlabens sp.]
MTALQLVGSPTSQFFFDLSMLYAGKVVCPVGFDLIYAVAYPDGYWQIKKDLHDVTPTLSLTEMMTGVKHCDVAVPHMFCEQGLTTVRILVEELLHIPMVGSNGYVLKIAQDKNWTKLIAQQAGIQVPNGVLLNNCESKAINRINLDLPVIIKPNNADNSDGLTLARTTPQLEKGVNTALTHDTNVLIEEYIDGRELRGGILHIDGRFEILPFIEYNVSETNPIRLATDKLEFDKDGNLKGQSAKEKIPATCPASIAEPLHQKLSKMMEVMFTALNCRDFAMFDFRIDKKTHEPFLLEAGLFWSFSSKSMMSNMLDAAGMNLEEVTSNIWHQAINRD